MSRKPSVVLLPVLLLAAFAAPTFAWKFVSMADSRGSTNGVNTAELTKIVNLVKLENADLVIFQGDAVNGSTSDTTLGSQMDTWLAIMNTLNCPWYYTVGNHEISTSTSQNVIRSKVNMPLNGPAGDEETVFSFDHQNAHFVALNSNKYSQSHHVQRSWLTTDLAGTVQPHVFVMAHEPAYPVDGHIGSSLDYYPTERDDFWNIMSAKGVRMYFTGHEHLYSRTTHGSIYQVINGSCGAPLYTAPPGAISTYHYVLVEINGLNVTCQAKNDTGGVIDSWSYSIPPVDTEPPTVPQNLRSTGATGSTIALAWDASTDNVGVVGYRVYRNGAPVGTATNTTYTDSGLALNTTYSYEVDAYDATPNYSAKSTAIFATTSSVVTEWIIESRSGGLGYSESGPFADDGPTSTAAGCTQGIGFRYTSAAYAGRYANYTFTPLVAGTYNIYATWGKYVSNPAIGCSAVKYDLDGAYVATQNQSVNWNTWQQIGGTTGVLTPSNHVIKQYYAITFSGKWLIANAVKMVRVAQAYMLTLTPSPSAGGTCGGAGYKLPGNASISASANTGWAFAKWSNDSAGADTVSTSTPYTYSMPASDKTLYAIFSDTAPPTGTIAINGAAQYTQSDIITLTLSATDPYSGTGVSEMQFNNENGAWSGWETYSPSKSWTLSGGDGAKTVYAQFKDAAGNISTGTISDEIALDTDNSIAEAKNAPADPMTLRDKVLYFKSGGIGYIEETDRSSGIRIQGDIPADVDVDHLVTVLGRPRTNGDQERYMELISITEGDSRVVDPIVLTNRDIGGETFGLQTGVWEYRPGVGLAVASGLNNIGLLVTALGEVTDIGSDYFYIHDGSGMDDGDELVKGLRVSGVYGGSVGDYVMVTGASSCVVKSGNIVRLLIPRSTSDIITLWERPA